MTFTLQFGGSLLPAVVKVREGALSLPTSHRSLAPLMALLNTATRGSQIHRDISAVRRSTRMFDYITGEAVV